MTDILKDLPFTIAYLDDIIIFSRTAEEHLDHIRQVFKNLQNTHLSMKLSKCHFFAKEIQYPGQILSTTDIRPFPSKTQSINNMHPPKTAEQVCTFLGLVVCYRKFIKDFAKIAKPLTLLTHHKAKFEQTPVHHTALMLLKETIIQAPILCYPEPARRYLAYTDASDDACGVLSQEHNGTKFPIAFLSHTFPETQRKYCTPEQEAYGVYYAITKWNYYLQAVNIIVHNNHNPLAQFLNGKNANNKVNR